MIAESLAKMASSFQNYMCRKKCDLTKVCDEVNATLDLNEEEQIKAYVLLIETNK